MLCIFYGRLGGSSDKLRGGFVTGSDCVKNAVRYQEVVLGSIGFVRLQRLFLTLMYERVKAVQVDCTAP